MGLGRGLFRAGGGSRGARRRRGQDDDRQQTRPGQSQEDTGGSSSTRRRSGRSGGDVEVRGLDQLDVVARRLKDMERNLQKDVLKEIRASTKPLIAKTRSAARDTLPQAGGLAARVAKAPQRVTARGGFRSGSVRVTVAGKKSGAAGADKGRVRHPVFGRPGTFVTQDVPAGWFSDTMREEAPEVRKDVEKVIEKALDRVARRL